MISPPPAWHQQRVSEPHGFAVRSSADHLARQLTAHEVHLALRLPCAPDALTSTASRPALVTTRDRPSCRNETVMDIEVIWVRPERKYFCKWGWTAELLNTTDLPVGQNQFIRFKKFARSAILRIGQAMSRMAVLTLANGCRTFSKVMGFASAQPILRAECGRTGSQRSSGRGSISGGCRRCR